MRCEVHNISTCPQLGCSDQVEKIPGCDEFVEYHVTLKDEYKPKDELDQKQYYRSLLERVVDCFASEALTDLKKEADFEALLTGGASQTLSNDGTKLRLSVR